MFTVFNMSEPSKENISAQPNVSIQTDIREKKKPTCIIILGMAGSGKTTFVQRLVSILYNVGKPYVINLDPACSQVPYPANIGNILYYIIIVLL